MYNFYTDENDITHKLVLSQELILARWSFKEDLVSMTCMIRDHLLGLAKISCKNGFLGCGQYPCRIFGSYF